MSQLNDILQRLEVSLGPCSGTPVPLEGGITNHNFRVTLGGTAYVVRQHGTGTELLGIDRESERLATQAAAQLRIGPALAASLPDAMATEFVRGTPVSAQEAREAVGQIAKALRSFHDSGTKLPRSFRIPELLEDYARIVQQRGGALPASYAELSSLAARIVGALAPERARPCHNDLLTSNLIRALSGQIVIVDWEYAGMGDRRFDLGNLSVNNDFDDDADERLLAAYFGEAPKDSKRAALKLARILSDVREAAWGMLQAEISELEFDFTGYANEHHERLRAATVSHSFEEWIVAAGA